MAFDMVFEDTSKRRDLIDHDEEFFFPLIEQLELKCPELDRLWEAFYDGPLIHANQAASLVSELLLLDSKFQTMRPPPPWLHQWNQLQPRLSEFFASAAASGTTIRCISD